MNKKKELTKLETKLYEELTEFHNICKRLDKDLVNYIIVGDDKKREKLEKLIKSLVKIRNILKKTKIPKKFLILNKLKENNKDE